MATTIFNDELVPFGDYCYHRWAVSDIVTRETCLVTEPHNICPYWQMTDHGTIRCERIGREAVIDDHEYIAHLHLAETILGVDGLERIRTSSSLLGDQIKICDINPDVPGLDEPEGEDLLTWRK